MGPLIPALAGQIRKHASLLLLVHVSSLVWAVAEAVKYWQVAVKYCECLRQDVPSWSWQMQSLYPPLVHRVNSTAAACVHVDPKPALQSQLPLTMVPCRLAIIQGWVRGCQMLCECMTWKDRRPFVCVWQCLKIHCYFNGLWSIPCTLIMQCIKNISLCHCGRTIKKCNYLYMFH